MAIGITILIIGVLVAAIWIIVELKRFKHKLFAIFLIALILATYLSFSVVFQNHEIDYKSPTGLVTAGKLYFSWLGSIFGNFKSITTDAVKMDWKANVTLENLEE